MLGILARIALGCLVVAVADVIISGIINKQAIREQMQKKDMEIAVVKKIDNCNNTVKLEDMNGNELTIKGDRISNEIYECQCISV